MKLDIFKRKIAFITKTNLDKPVSLHHNYFEDC